MPRLTPARAAERRRQILDAAVACFARRGFRGTTMQHICARARLSPGAVYCWFASKQQIVAAIAAERHARERAIFARAAATGDVRAAAAQFFGEVIGWLAAPSERDRLRLTAQIWIEALFDPKLRRTLDAGIAQRALATRFVRRAQRTGALPRGVTADAAGRVIVSLLLGFVLQQVWEPALDAAAYRDAATAMLAAFARGPRRRARDRG